MRLRLPDRGERGERGAIAVLTALLAVLVLAMAALGVDIATQTNQRQKLHDTIDAAAHAGAYDFPNSPGSAESDARANALKNDPTLSLPTTPVNAVAFFCVVASLSAGVPGLVDNSQIPATCNPLSVRGGSSPNYTWTGSKCNATICSIPCSGAVGTSDVCNTVRVSATKTVPFAFAPVIGINSGSTGSVSSAACKGSCGTIPLNPMDVAVVADRTGSMSSTDITAMISGIKSMFQVMTPSQQYVALGTIGRSKQGPSSTSCTGSAKAWSEPSTSTTVGPWIPVPFSMDYLNADKTINAGSTLVSAVECLKNSSSTQTHLASPMKAAARYLLGIDPNSYPVGSTARTGTIRKAIIFETDGQPNESIAAGGSTTLTVAGDISANSNGALACTNMKTVAGYAKEQGILIVTVAYNLSGLLCGSSGSATVASELAAAASEKSIGFPSLAENTCSSPAQRTFENGDGDFFFCATAGATSAEMAKIFTTAFTQIANGIRLIQLP